MKNWEHVAGNSWHCTDCDYHFTSKDGGCKCKIEVDWSKAEWTITYGSAPLEPEYDEAAVLKAHILHHRPDYS